MSGLILSLLLSSQAYATPLDNRIRKATEEVLTAYEFPPHVEAYLGEYMDDALALERRYGVPAAAALAKAGSEHSFGSQGQVVGRTNNHFGIKFNEQFSAEHPNCLQAETWEFNPANKEVACFVVYDSARESFLDFGKYLTERKIGEWKPYAAVVEQHEPKPFLEALAKSPYSTRPDEFTFTSGILERYHLEEIVSAVKEKLPKQKEE